METPRGNLSYRDIKKIVLDRIQNRTWLPDSILPNETDLAMEFSSTRTTVNRAMRELAEEGYLERKRKTGTRVLNSPTRQAKFTIPLVQDEIVSSGFAYRYWLVEQVSMPAPGWLAARLGLSNQQRVVHVRCMHYADNKPFQYETRWINAEVVPQVLEADFSTSGPNEWLVQTMPFTNVELSFSASKTDQELAGFLDASPGDPVFTAERITWLQNAPVTFVRLYFAPGYRMTTYL